MQVRLPRSAGGRRGVSHVIGVVLLIAVTIVLVSVVAVYVTGFGGEMQQPAPQFVSTTEYNSDWEPSGQYLNVTHESGDSIETANLYLDVDGAAVVDASSYAPTGAEATPHDVIASQVGDDLTATETLVINASAFSNVRGGERVDLGDATVRIVYDHPNEQRTSTLYECRPAGHDCEETST